MNLNSKPFRRKLWYLDSFPRELGSSGSALERPGLVQLDETFVILQSHPGLSVKYLSFSEHADIGAGIRGVLIFAVSEDGAVEEGQIITGWVVVLHEGLHQAAGAVDVHLSLWRLRLLHQLVVHGVAAQRDHGVAAHGAVPLVVHEQHPHVRLGYLAVHDQGAVHVVVAARLVHQHLPQVIQMFPDVTPLGQHAVTFDLRVAAADDP
ncbi:hypothetical protein EYF80_007190 [Liparis tanakae]|uniref:Uncharacterized protein n=1 Tax=Liparis tanakae TaxID=230148 RepID=A0A4Z2IZG1_9TELE|nr:hypothetical protein EYF80_007190 [Liparis tanakae]